MDWNWTLALAACGVGIVVGLTGMGGGALMTPVLVLFFNVPPLTAVSSDLVSAAIMKPVGSFVHFRRGTVNLKLVGWLCVGSVPAAFSGVLVARALGKGARVAGRDPDRARHRAARRRVRPDPAGVPASAGAGPQPRRPGRTAAAGPPAGGRPRPCRPLPSVPSAGSSSA